MPPTPRIHFFKSAAAFRAWLEKYADTVPEVIVGYWKVATGKPTMTWSESVDEALCVGWIDGIRRRVDDASYCIRFTPRRKHSVWSAVNLAKVTTLTKQGRMRPAGLAAHARRSASRSRIYAYEQSRVPTLTPAERRRFKAQSVAWRYFEATPPGYQKLVMRYLDDAKRPETRARRLDHLIGACARGMRLY